MARAKIGQSRGSSAGSAFVIHALRATLAAVALIAIKAFESGVVDGGNGIGHRYCGLKGGQNARGMVANGYAGRNGEGIELQREAAAISHCEHDHVGFQFWLAQQKTIFISRGWIEHQKRHLEIAPELDQQREREIAFTRTGSSDQQRGLHQIIGGDVKRLAALAVFIWPEIVFALIQVAYPDLAVRWLKSVGCQ